MPILFGLLALLVAIAAVLWLRARRRRQIEEAELREQQALAQLEMTQAMADARRPPAQAELVEPDDPGAPVAVRLDAVDSLPPEVDAEPAPAGARRDAADSDLEALAAILQAEEMHRAEQRAHAEAEAQAALDR
ncbi:MAG: hypothetical protein KAY56_13015, partial [Inhella sp.]|nr:hypothetical protein [Inhella sp.]